MKSYTDEIKEKILNDSDTNDILLMVLHANDIMIQKLASELSMNGLFTDIVSNAIEQQHLISEYFRKQNSIL